MTPWPVVRVEDIAAPEPTAIAIGPFGSRMKAENYTPSGVPVVRGNNVVGSRSPRGEFVFVSDEFAAGLPHCILRPGDLVFPHRGAIGEVGLIEGPPQTKMILSTSLMKLTPDSSLADPLFVYYYFSSGLGRGELLMRASTVGTPGIGQPLTSLRSIPIPLPPVEEQRAIAATLGALDDKIESNRRKIELSVGLAQAHFERLFDAQATRRGVPITEYIAVNPKRYLPNGTMATHIGMSDLDEFSPTVFRWSTRSTGSGQRFRNGDVVMARITPCLENGKTAVIDMLADGEVAWGSTEYVVLSPRETACTPWVYCLVRTEEVRNFAISSMTGTSGRQRFTASRLSEYRIQAPRKDALGEFAALALPLFARSTQLRDEVHVLTDLREALMPELLSGQLRVGVCS